MEGGGQAAFYTPREIFLSPPGQGEPRTGGERCRPAGLGAGFVLCLLVCNALTPRFVLAAGRFWGPEGVLRVFRVHPALHPQQEQPQRGLPARPHPCAAGWAKRGQTPPGSCGGVRLRTTSGHSGTWGAAGPIPPPSDPCGAAVWKQGCALLLPTVFARGLSSSVPPAPASSIRPRCVFLPSKHRGAPARAAVRFFLVLSSSKTQQKASVEQRFGAVAPGAGSSHSCPERAGSLCTAGMGEPGAGSVGPGGRTTGQECRP